MARGRLEGEVHARLAQPESMWTTVQVNKGTAMDSVEQEMPLLAKSRGDDESMLAGIAGL